MSESITIGTNTFRIGQKGSDRSRRQQYFTRGTGSLKPDEDKLLNALGIDSDLREAYKLYLPTFFDKLPFCQSDTPLILSKSCEIPHFILWSVMFRSNQATQARVAQDRIEHQSLSDISIATTEEVVKAFQPTAPPRRPSSGSTASTASTASSASSASSTRSPTPASIPSARSPTRQPTRPASASASQARPTQSKGDDILRLFTIPYV